ncbi:MAG: ABC transporter permease subunit [Vicinamibacterales bacterium]
MAESSAWRRILSLARKDADEIRSQPALLVPAALLAIGLTLPGLGVLVLVPRLAGEALADSDFGEAAAAAARTMPVLLEYEPEARAQVFVLQQFLLFGLLVPAMGALALAAQGIIGEKQARTLEPLLATPIRTSELLLAKVLVPFAVAMALLAATFVIYLAATWGWAEPGVWRSLLWPRTLVLYVLVAPLISLTALMLAAIVSARVNDARAAQQLGVLVVLPIVALFLSQLVGQFLLGTTALLAVAVVIALADLLLVWVGVRVFDRETILLRWR